MSITYEEALSTLSAMFSAPWTTESLDWILRHFEGHMENTVDAILTHGDSNPQDLIARLEKGQDVTAMDEQLARSLATQEETSSQSISEHSRTEGELSAVGNAGISNARRESHHSSNSNSASSTAQGKGRGMPTVLPVDFLRIPGSNMGASAAAASSASSTAQSTLESDEALARMLQDKLFAQELKNNPEFAHLARGVRGAPSADNVNWGLRSNASGIHSTREGPGVMDALAGMGEGAKRRLTELAQKVRTNVEKINQQNGERNGMSGVFGGVRPSEKRGLLDLDDENDHDTEEISFARQDTDYEMRHMGFASGKKSN